MTNKNLKTTLNCFILLKNIYGILVTLMNLNMIIFIRFIKIYLFHLKSINFMSNNLILKNLKHFQLQ